jgi:threonine dehydrogenase-like Zn-dependent dehydrogenase
LDRARLDRTTQGVCATLAHHLSVTAALPSTIQPNDNSPNRTRLREKSVMPRRLAFVAPYQAALLDYEEQPLQPQQVRIKTEIASGKHGTTMGMFDSRTFQGQEFDQSMRLFIEADADAPVRMPSYENPWNVGTTGVGTVVEVGPEVTRWKVGDRVFGTMDVRETNVCRTNRIWELGELGLLAVRMAVLSGAETVIAIDMLPNRRAAAQQMGADFVFDPREGDVARKVHEVNGGPGVDVAIELAGVYPALQTAIRCVRVGGTICSAGFYQGEAKGIWLGREWHHNRLNMIVPHGCGWGHPPRDYPRWDEQRAYDALASLMRKGKLTAKGLVTPVVPLEEGPEIFHLIQHEPEKVIKFAVRF